MESKEDNRIIRAFVETSENEDYDFKAIASPKNNGQIRYSFMNEEYFKQVLLVEESNIDRSRLDSGIPIFDNHDYDKSAVKTLGISVGYDFTERGLEIKVKLGARADEALRSDIKNGIIKTMSVEGDILEYNVIRREGELPVYEATKWEPTSVSFAPVPQDIESQIEVKRAIQKQVQPKQQSFINNLLSKF